MLVLHFNLNLYVNLFRMEREFMDYKKLGIDLNQFMGSSSSIGAKRVTNVCVAFRVATEQNNRAGWVPYSLFIRAILAYV